MKLPTKDEIYQKLLKLDSQKYATITQDDIKIEENGCVRVKGKFVKGFSGNPKGKPSKKKLKLSNLTKEEKKIFGKNSKKALEHLLKTATSRTEVERIANKLLPFQSPKLANIESKNFQETKIEIKWIDQDPSQGGEIIDMDPEDYKIQEKAALKLLNVKEDIEKEKK